MTGHEYNDLTDPKLSSTGSRKISLESTKEVSNTSGSSGASAGSAAGAATTAAVIPAVVVATVVSTIVVALSVLSPTVELKNFDISHEYLSFEFVAEEVENPYILSLDLEGKTIEEKILDNELQTITFHDLLSETEYQVIVYNDYGFGNTKVYESIIKTAGKPTFPDGQIRISEHFINYEENLLTLKTNVNDQESYLSSYRVVISDGYLDEEHLFNKLEAIEQFDISRFARGYLTVDIYAYSSHTTYGLKENLYTKYKVYY